MSGGLLLGTARALLLPLLDAVVALLGSAGGRELSDEEEEPVEELVE